MNIGERIRQRRIELGMSQDELAKRCGYKSRSSINKIELSRDLPLKKAQQFANILDIPIEELCGWNKYNYDKKIINPYRNKKEKLFETEDLFSDYYDDDDTAQVAQEIFENKDLKLLFDAARDASPEDLKTAHNILLALKAKEQGKQ